jgi:hypothetical protein
MQQFNDGLPAVEAMHTTSTPWRFEKHLLFKTPGHSRGTLQVELLQLVQLPHASREAAT